VTQDGLCEGCGEWRTDVQLVAYRGMTKLLLLCRQCREEDR
jgi:hypothetical protein